MSTKTNKLFTGFRKIFIHAGIIACTVSLLESCECEKVWHCNNPAVCGNNVLTDRPPDNEKLNWTETEFCQFKPFNMLYELKFGSSIPAGNTEAGDSVARAGRTDSTRQTRSPIIINGPVPGEYFATTISAGAGLSIKSSHDEYGGGYGNHDPGIGFNAGLGTVLPFSQHWGIAPSVRFTQKKASETISYSEPGSSMEFKDTYTYNYIGTSLLAQYRAGKHLSFAAGPEINYLVSSSVKYGGSSGTGEKQSLTKSSNKVGMDILAGVKYELPSAAGRSRWGLQLFYDHRLSRLNKKKDENGFDVPAYNVKGFQLGLAYNICNCGKKAKK